MLALPRMAVLTAPRVASAFPVSPESPEFPDSAVGSAIAVEDAGPVLPVLVDEDCAHDVPESPDWATGDWSFLTLPPAPPSADTLAIESPPVTEPPVMRLLRPRTVTRALALPARSERARAPLPPKPPSPPAARSLSALIAVPVSPDVADASLAAPLLAMLFAEPVARALPVSPVRPESPERTVPPSTRRLAAVAAFRAPAVRFTLPVSPVLPESPDLATPLAADVASPVPPELPESPEMALPAGSAEPFNPVFTAPIVALTLPVRPVSPESPESASPSDTAVELAEPVLPVLVEEDCAMAAPESPDTAAGLCVDLMSPPAPPLAEVLAMESPPVTFGAPPLARDRASPARAERARAPLPASPPVPPMSVERTALSTSPVVAGREVGRDAAPELATLVASPVIRASPVVPELPESPDRAVPPTLALPLMPVLMAPAVRLTSPVAPVLPESPDIAVGLPTAVELAPPVLPVLVAEDCAVDGPESPEMAVGVCEALMLPPSPP